MGIKDLYGLYKDNFDLLPIPIKGKLLVNGNSVLHELYRIFKIEWATGGCYADQVRATQEYYGALVRAGVEPIVVLDGGGQEINISDTVHRRNKDINNLSGVLRKQHEVTDKECKEYRSHQLPILSRHVYLSSLKQIQGVKLFVADGKCFEMIVQLANSHGCPILTNSSNYCVSGVKGGIIFTSDLNLNNMTAPLFEQSSFVSYLNLPNPDLMFAIVALMGDGSDTSVPCLYHGGIRVDIHRVCEQQIKVQEQGIKVKDRHSFLNIVDYFRAHDCKSLEDFKNKIDAFDFKYGQKQKLMENCRYVLEIYNIPEIVATEENIVGHNTLPCHTSYESFHQVVRYHREGNYPIFVMDAMSAGKCVLDSDIGDAEQPPVPLMGRHVRRVMYGLVKPLMSRSFRKGIVEYYRSKEVDPETKEWEYAPVTVEPLSLWTYKDVSVDVIFDLEQAKREAVAKKVMLDVLRLPEGTKEEFCQPSDEVYLLGIFTTHYWIQNLYQSNPLDNLSQLIRALVLNFLMCPQSEDYSHDQSYSHPMWIKVYHALLQWQCLYKDVCGLNQMLLSPFRELPLTNILNGSFVIKMALAGPDSITGHKEKLSPEKRDFYDKTIQILDNIPCNPSK